MILTDGAAGNERQALALADAMGLEAGATRLRLRAPWSWFSPHLRAGAWGALPRSLRDALALERPHIVIGCGRASALATAVLRNRLGCFAVQVLDPRTDTEHWDVIVAPAHDGLRGANVVTTIGALNTITPARLAAAALEHADLAQLSAPRTAVLIGGTNRAQRIDAAYLAALLARLAAWHERDGGSFLVTTSRRTDPGLVAPLRALVAQRGGRVWTGAADGRNPYLGFLAHAHRIVATPDSVNLVSEACATGKPVFVFEHEPVRGKLAGFHRALRAADRVRPLDPDAVDWQPQPLRETAAVAEEVLRRFRTKRPEIP